MDRRTLIGAAAASLFAATLPARAQAPGRIMLSDPLYNINRKRLADLAAAHRVPACGAARSTWSPAD